MMFRFWSSAYVQHLEREIEWLRLENQKGQQRYEVATAALVAIQTQGQANVHPRPLIADRESAVAQEIEKVFADSEFSQVGS